MNPYEFVLALVAVIGVIKLIRDREARGAARAVAATADTDAVAAEVVRLRERVEVLERALTDPGRRLSAEIEDLRR